MGIIHLFLFFIFFSFFSTCEIPVLPLSLSHRLSQLGKKKKFQLAAFARRGAISLPLLFCRRGARACPHRCRAPQGGEPRRGGPTRGLTKGARLARLASVVGECRARLTSEHGSTPTEERALENGRAARRLKACARGRAAAGIESPCGWR